LNQPRPQVWAEICALGALGLPLVGAQLAQMAMGFVDTVMTAKLGAVPLAAVALGNSLWNPLFLFSLGVLLSLTATASPLVGAGRLEDLPGWLYQTLWLSLGLGLLAVVLLNHAELVLSWMVPDTQVVAQAQGYLSYLSLGAPAFFAYLSFRCLCESLGRTRPILLTTLVGLVVNIFSNYAFIFGHFGLPAMGARGCGLATAITFWVMLLILASYTLKQRRLKHLINRHTQYLPQLAKIWQLLILGLPIGVSIFLESGLFAATTLLLGGFGPVVLAGHQIAMNVAALTFMVPLGLSQALTVRVGRAAGQGNRLVTRHRGVVGIVMAGFAMAVLALLIVLGRGNIVAFYTDDVAVQQVALGLLLVAALFQVSDGLQIGAAGALRGLRDTRFAMMLGLLGYWGVAAPLAYFSTQAWGFGPVGAWYGLAIGVSIAAVGLIIRFLYLLKYDDIKM